VFAASAAALVLSSALAVLLGQAAQGWLAKLPLSLIAGVIFIVLGLFSIWDYFR
jgi:putative Ca2+/H+ antiporter (TMEM165/GDT1 family)